MPFILPISSAFAHTHCISPSVCLLKSFMQAYTFAPSPLADRASAIRSRTCGRQRLAFLAVSSTGGARKPNPSEGGEGAPAPCMDYSSVLPSAGRSLPLFFCTQKKSRKTVKEKFRPLPSRSRVRLPPKGGINAPPETWRFLISTASPTGSRADFQYPSDARPP